MGCEFYTLEACWLTSVGVLRSGLNQTAAVTCRLYRITGTTTAVQVGSDWTITLSGSTWNNGAPASPIALTANQRYRVVCLFPDFAAKIASYFTSGPGANGLGNGLLVIPNRANATNLAQNAFVSGASIAYPTTGNSDGPSYLIDPNVTDVDPAGATPGTASPIYGTDVSSAYGAVNIATLQANGVGYVLARVGQGASSTGNGQLIDSQWAANRDNCRKQRMPLGAYWYLGDTESAASQASRCRAAMGEPGIPLCLDWEEGGGDWTNLLACLTAFRNAGLNVKMLYSRYTYYLNNGGRDLVPLRLALWNSRYPSSNAGTPSALYSAVSSDRATYWQTYGGVTSKILQYSNNATIGSYTAADADAFNGSQAELESLLAPAGGASFLPLFPDRVKVG
jgi:hypothetical protein